MFAAREFAAQYLQLVPSRQPVVVAAVDEKPYFLSCLSYTTVE